MKRRIETLCSILLIILFSACSTKNADSIIGTWETVYQSQTMTYTFEDDGSLIFYNKAFDYTEYGK